MNKETILLDEPLLEFAYGQTAQDPRQGLSVYGPHDLLQASHPEKVSYALVGSDSGMEAFRRFSTAWKMPMIPDPNKVNTKIWPAFPGFEAVFSSTWHSSPVASHSMSAEKLDLSVRNRDAHKRVGEVVDQYLEKIRLVKETDDRKDVVVCVVPDIVFTNCRPESQVKNGIGSKLKKGEQKNRYRQTALFGDYNSDHYNYFPDFRRQIKARAMEHGLAIQIIRESTLALTDKELDFVRLKYKRGLTPAADRAWNIGTTLFYKAGGKPWRLSSIRDGVCYIGISFRKTNEDDQSKSACCAAQMFLQDGDGVIFKGEEGVWHSPEDKMFHLSPDGAKKLLTGVISAYQRHGGKPLKEIFLHCPSEISENEFMGFQAACPSGCKLVAVRVRREPPIRLFRNGTRPVVRGTFLKLDKKSGLLWASGFKYQLASYDGTEIPIPLKIDVQHGDAEIEQIAKDILGLTKLNYNACRFGESEPVTIGFSQAVGEILVSNPGTKPLPNFKFYI